MAKNLLSQSSRFLKAQYQPGLSRASVKALKGPHGLSPVITSVNTFRQYVAAIANAARAMGVKRLKEITPEMANDYLAKRCATGLSQKTLDRDRVALQRIVGSPLTKQKALSKASPKPRAYSHAQVRLIANAQTPANALATEIAHAAGLRAHELLTLRRHGEQMVSDRGQWRSDRFSGRKEGVVYLVQGKGGLVREVLIPNHLAIRLEACRRPEAKLIVDRKIHYQSLYVIGGGQSWSQSFSEASKRALGFSNGAHGVRHSYAQNRINVLMEQRHITYRQAKTIVSQELGHFRPDITNVYLR